MDTNTVNKIKHTGSQCKEVTTKFWRWMGYENLPAIAILPNYDKRNDPWSNHYHCIDYKEIGRIATAGNIIMVEWLRTKVTNSKSHYIFEFESSAEAQTFAKRLKRGKHQVIIAGDGFIRAVMISSNPEKIHAHTLQGKLLSDAIRNTVSYIGKSMTKGEVNYYEFMESDSYDALVEKVTALYKGKKKIANNTPHVIGEIISSEMFEEEAIT